MKTFHKIIVGDSRRVNKVQNESVHLIVTSPPYWQLKDYGNKKQIGFNDSYEDYINNLNLIWNECCRILHKGCRLCINIGDQFARSVYYGRYKIIPIRTEIIKFCESIGFDYEPNDHVKTRIGFAMRQTIADVYAHNYSDDPETIDDVEKIKNELGAESVTDVRLKLNSLIEYASKLEIFSTVERVDEVIVRWDNLFSAKLAEYISVSLNFKLYYDKKASLKRQLKQILAVGLTHTFL